MLIKRFLRCQGISWWREGSVDGEGSISEKREKLPQEEPGHEQKDQGYAQQQGHLKQRLPGAQGIGRNQITHRLFSGRRLLAAALASLRTRIRQGCLPIEA
jgi:hypothetical protein